MPGPVLYIGGPCPMAVGCWTSMMVCAGGGAAITEVG